MRSSLSPMRLSARVPAKSRADHLWELSFHPLDALVILEMALHHRQMPGIPDACVDRPTRALKAGVAGHPETARDPHSEGDCCRESGGVWGQLTYT
jgi:hypothetical protein